MKMKVKERLKMYIARKGMTNAAFEKSLGVSNGYINSINKSMGLDKIQLIIELYPDLNLDWLFAEKGAMLKAETAPPTNILLKTRLESLETLQELASLQREKIDRLQAANQKLKKRYADLSQHVSIHQQELKTDK